MKSQSEFVNLGALLLIILWSLVIFFTKPTSIYGSNLKRITFHFWLIFWFASAFFYFIRKLNPVPSLIGLAVQLSVTDVNSILALAIYFSYTRGKDFKVRDFLRTWVPLYGTLVLYTFLWVIIYKDAAWGQDKAVRTLMLTPSLGIAMLASFLVGWGFYLKHRREAVIFPFVSAVWALVQLPLYILSFVLLDMNTAGKMLWLLIFLKILISLMFFYFIITLPLTPETEESVFRPAIQNTPFPAAIKKWLLLILSSAGGVLALLQISRWVRELFN